MSLHITLDGFRGSLWRDFRNSPKRDRITGLELEDECHVLLQMFFSDKTGLTPTPPPFPTDPSDLLPWYQSMSKAIDDWIARSSHPAWGASATLHLPRKDYAGYATEPWYLQDDLSNDTFPYTPTHMTAAYEPVNGWGWTLQQDLGYADVKSGFLWVKKGYKVLASAADFEVDDVSGIFNYDWRGSIVDRPWFGSVTSSAHHAYRTGKVMIETAWPDFDLADLEPSGLDWTSWWAEFPYFWPMAARAYRVAKATVVPLKSTLGWVPGGLPLGSPAP